jgi:hypothetical protein
VDHKLGHLAHYRQQPFERLERRRDLAALQPADRSLR